MIRPALGLAAALAATSTLIQPAAAQGGPPLPPFPTNPVPHMTGPLPGLLKGFTKFGVELALDDVLSSRTPGCQVDVANARRALAPTGNGKPNIGKALADCAPNLDIVRLAALAAPLLEQFSSSASPECKAAAADAGGDLLVKQPSDLRAVASNCRDDAQTLIRNSAGDLLKVGVVFALLGVLENGREDRFPSYNNGEGCSGPGPLCMLDLGQDKALSVSFSYQP